MDTDDIKTTFRRDTIGDLTTQQGDGPVLLADRYKVIRKLGEGGMGSVWLAEDPKLDNHSVAIKMLPAIFATNKRAALQLKQEAKLAIQLSHPHIVTLRSYEDDEGGAFLVMDYIEGQTLEDLLAENGPLSETKAIHLFTPIAEAIDYAHSQKVIHRDIKPSNILIRKDGTPFITDFGVAREMKDTMTRVTGRSMSGTLPYMSPEQFRGEAPHPAQDIYSLSATLYECLTGNPPFHRGNIEHQILNEAPKRLASNSIFANAIMSGLSKARNHRPTSAMKIVFASRSHLGPNPPKLPRPPSRQPRSSLPKRTKNIRHAKAKSADTLVWTILAGLGKLVLWPFAHLSTRNRDRNIAKTQPDISTSRQRLSNYIAEWRRQDIRILNEFYVQVGRHEICVLNSWRIKALFLDGQLMDEHRSRLGLASTVTLHGDIQLEDGNLHHLRAVIGGIPTIKLFMDGTRIKKRFIPQGIPSHSRFDTSSSRMNRRDVNDITGVVREPPEPPPSSPATSIPDIECLDLALQANSFNDVHARLQQLSHSATPPKAVAAAISKHTAIPHQFDQAYIHFIEAALARPDLDHDTLLAAAMACRNRNQLFLAKEAAEKAIERQSHSRQAKRVLADIYRRQAQTEKAAERERQQTRRKEEKARNKLAAQERRKQRIGKAKKGRQTLTALFAVIGMLGGVFGGIAADSNSGMDSEIWISLIGIVLLAALGTGIGAVVGYMLGSVRLFLTALRR